MMMVTQESIQYSSPLTRSATTLKQSGNTWFCGSTYRDAQSGNILVLRNQSSMTLGWGGQDSDSNRSKSRTEHENLFHGVEESWGGWWWEGEEEKKQNRVYAKSKETFVRLLSFGFVLCLRFSRLVLFDSYFFVLPSFSLPLKWWNVSYILK